MKKILTFALLILFTVSMNAQKTVKSLALTKIKGHEQITKCPSMVQNTKDTLLFEEFSDTVIPTGWTTYMLGDSAGWSIDTANHCAYHADDDVTTGCDDWLVTPAIAVSNVDDMLGFYQYVQYGSYADQHQVLVMDGADPSTATILDTLYEEIGPKAWEFHNYFLGAYNGQTIYIAFRYTGDYADRWRIDNVSVSLVPRYDVTFNVTDGTAPIDNALITVANETAYTNASGVATIGLPDGAYAYKIEKEGVQTYNDSVTVAGAPLTVNATMIATLDITFNVTDGTNPIGNASIYIDDKMYMTDSATGTVVIPLLNGTYGYKIAKDGYTTLSDTVVVDGAAATVNKTLTMAVGVLYENFESNVFLPPLWTETANAANFQQSSVGAFYSIIGHSASVTQKLGKPEEMLITPMLELDGTINELSFRATDGNGTYGFGNGMIVVKYSTDKTTWTNIGDTIQLNQGVQSYSVDLSSIPNGDYYFAFAFSSSFDYSTYNSVNAIDSVRGPAYKLANSIDLGVAAVSPSLVETDSSAYPTVTVVNYGSAVANDFSITVVVNDGTSDVYTSTKAITGANMGALGATEVTMDDNFAPTFAGAYTLTATVTIASDEVADNNTMSMPGAVGYIMKTGTLTTCSGSFFDVGGLYNSYTTDENDTLTIYPSTADAIMTVHFDTIDMESTYDFLYVYDGADATAPLIAKFSGEFSDTTILATNDAGALTFVCTSDGGVETSGWNAQLNCLVGVRDVTFTVKDGTTPIMGASISVNGQTLVTDSLGVAVAKIQDGNYPYTVSMDNYYDVVDTLVVNGANVEENVSMTRIYKVLFKVTDGTTGIHNAQILINNDTLLTGVTGMIATYIPNGEYPYSITADGYNDFTGSLTIANADTTVDISLVPVGIEGAQAINFIVYPNPSNGVVNFKLNGTYNVSIMNAIGQVVATKTVNNSGSIDLSNQAAGIYFVNVKSNEGTITKRIVIE